MPQSTYQRQQMLELVPSPRSRRRLHRLWLAQAFFIVMIGLSIIFKTPLFMVAFFGVLLIGSTTIFNETPS